MLCANCSKLSILNSKKTCSRCQGVVLNNISVLCETCSNNNKQCSVCLKKVVSAADRARARGCGCGGRK